MTRAKGRAGRDRAEAPAKLLASVPHVNVKAEVKEVGDGMIVSVPVRRPGWLVPPISWVLPWSSRRRVQLDPAGSAVLALCDGRRNVEQVIETFAQEHKLSFRESQLAVTQFLRELLKRGIVALVGTPATGPDEGGPVPEGLQ